MKKQQQIPLKLTYLTCRKKGEHENEHLNYICLQRACEQKGLVCSMCREDHAGHNVIPLKFLLSHLLKHKEKPIVDEEYSNHLEQIENIKSSILYELRLCVQGLAMCFQVLQQQIIDTFTSVKVQLLQQLNMKFSEVIANAVDEHIVDEMEYLANFKRIAGWVESVRGKEMRIMMELANIVEKYRVWHVGMRGKLGKVGEYVGEEMARKEVLKVKVVVGPQGHLPKIKYTFSPTLKGASIVMNPELTLAKQSSSSSTRFVLVEQGMGIKNRQISFKFPKMTNWVGVGVCIKSKIVASGYSFKYEQLGHGSYLLSNNGYTWSHTSTEDNIHSCQFTFKQQNIVDITLSDKELLFKVRHTGAVFSLKLAFKEEEWAEVCWCANICSAEDSVQIVDT